MDDINNPKNAMGSNLQCPSCGERLIFGNIPGKYNCRHCGIKIDAEAAARFAELKQESNTFSVDKDGHSRLWTNRDENALRARVCQSCGAAILTDITTTLGECPFCNSTDIKNGELYRFDKPDLMIPFRISKRAAQRAFHEMCKGRPFLPKEFIRAKAQYLDKLTPIYIPIILNSYQAAVRGSYNAESTQRWSDSMRSYSKNDRYILDRTATAKFIDVALKCSDKVPEWVLDEIGPFDYKNVVPFDLNRMPKHTVELCEVEPHENFEYIRKGTEAVIDKLLKPSFTAYSAVSPASKQTKIDNLSERHLLLPVWVLYINFQGENYIFAVNGQTGKSSGTLPFSKARRNSVAFAIGIVLALLIMAFQMLLGLGG